MQAIAINHKWNAHTFVSSTVYVASYDKKNISVIGHRWACREM